MKLQRVKVSSYRSIFDFSPGASPLELELADGINLLVGPNNCGKSNVVRAIELALEPGSTIDGAVDLPRNALRARPTVELLFHIAAGDPASDLLQVVETLHRAAGELKRTRHRSDQLVFKLGFERHENRDGYARRIDFGFKVGDDPAARKALERAVDLFYARVRFVITRSGESLESILEGKFREILRDVIEETLRDQYKVAVERREDYLDDLQQALFGPLTAQVSSDLMAIFPEVNDVELRPNVPGIDETIAKLSIRVADAAITDLAAKGTGVRGGVIAALFRYLAQHSRHSMVFALEEPESFLHPAAQESVRDSLERLALRDEITVIATTHSPFIVPHRADAQLIAIEKSPTGATSVAAVARGDEPKATLLGGLFRDPKLSYVLDSVSQVPADARAVLVVEGETDIAFLQTAARELGRAQELAGVHFVAAGGASAAATLALVLQAGVGRTVCSLFDNDDIGRTAFERLRGSTFKRVIRRTSVLNYRCAFSMPDLPYEAEDLFSPSLQAQFAAQYPAGTVETHERSDGSVHLEFHHLLKSEFAAFVSENATAADCHRWGAVLDALGRAIDTPVPVSKLSDSEGGARAVAVPSAVAPRDPVVPVVTPPVAEAALLHEVVALETGRSRRPTPLESLLKGALPEVRKVKELLDDWAHSSGVEVVPLPSSYAYRVGGRNVTLLWPQHKAIDCLLDLLGRDEESAGVRATLSELVGKPVDEGQKKRQLPCLLVLENWDWLCEHVLEPRRRRLAE